MKSLLDSLPQEVQNLIHLAGDIAWRNNMSAYLVGGFVRDLILGVKNLDLDIVVEGDGIRFAEDFAKHLKAKLIRHRRFETATIIPKLELKIDIASARKEFYPGPAHLPIVESATLKDDHFRRDFSINAMAIDISSGNFGKLIDCFGGKNDLRHKKIRILHNLSFIDDPTRILRAIRFEKRYNFKIESKTLRYLKESVKLGMLDRLEPQRIRDELILILKEERPLRQIMRLGELVGFSFIDPCLSVSKRTYKLMRSIEREIKWFKGAFPCRRQLDTWLIFFMGLIDSFDKNNTRRLCQKFTFRKGEEKRILIYKKIKPKFILGLSRKRLKPSRIFSCLEPLSYEVSLLLKAKYKNRRIQKHIKDFFEIYNDMRLYIRGDDLHKLGVAPGPNYQKIFVRVLNAKLNGSVKTKEEELALIKKLIKIIK